MLIYELSQKTYFVRHWFKWYKVTRGGADWKRLDYKARPAPFSLDKTIEALKQAKPKR